MNRLADRSAFCLRSGFGLTVCSSDLVGFRFGLVQGLSVFRFGFSSLGLCAYWTFISDGAGSEKKARLMPTVTLDEFDAQAMSNSRAEQIKAEQIKADLLKTLQINHGSEDGKVFLASMSRAAEAYASDPGAFWRNVSVNLVNSISAGRNIPDFSEGAQVVKSVLESTLLLTACINNTCVVGKEVLGTSLDLLREDVICGRCGSKGHYHSSCFSVPRSGGSKGGRGKGSNQVADFPSHLPPPYHPHPAQFGQFGPRPPPFG